MAQEVTVEIYVEKLKNLVHNDANPRLIKSKKHKELVQSLKQFPEMKLIREIVVDEKLLILAGDKRVYALEELGYGEVTVKKVIGLSEAKKREFIASQWNPEELEGWGVPVFKMPGQDEPEKEKPKKSREVTCPNCNETFDPSEA